MHWDEAIGFSIVVFGLSAFVIFLIAMLGWWGVFSILAFISFACIVKYVGDVV